MTISVTTLRAPLVGALAMVGAGAVFAGANTLVQLATMRMGAAPPVVAFGQYLAATLLFLPWIAGQARGGGGTRRWGAHLMRVLLAALGVQLWVAGLAYVPIWQAIALVMTSPVFVTLGAWALLGEAVGPARWGAVLAGLAGGAVVLAPWQEAFQVQALLPLGAAALWAGVSLMTKRLSATESAETLTLWLLLGLVPVNALVWGLEGGAIPGPSVLALIALAGALTAFAQYLIARAYGLADAAFLQPFDHVKLLFNVGLGAAVFGFLPPGRLWIGAALIVGASLMLVERERR